MRPPKPRRKPNRPVVPKSSIKPKQPPSPSCRHRRVGRDRKMGRMTQRDSDERSWARRRWPAILLFLAAALALSFRGKQALDEQRRAEAEKRQKRLVDGHFEQVKAALGRGDTLLAVWWLDRAYQAGLADSKMRFLLPHLTQTLRQTVLTLNHEAEVTQVRFVDFGRAAFTLSADGVARLFSIPDGKLLRKLDKVDSALVGLWHTKTDGPIVTLDEGGVARLYDRHQDKPVAVLTNPDGPGPLSQVALSADGSRVLGVVASEKTHTTCLWDGQTGKLVARLAQSKVPMVAVLFHPQGHRVAIASPQGVQLFDSQDGTRLATLAGHTDVVRDLLFSPDGKRLVSSSSDRTARLWDGETGAPVAVLEGHQGTVHSATFTLAQGRAVMTVSADGTARLWDAQTGASMFAPVTHPRRSQMLAVTRDGGRMVVLSENNELQLWDRILGHMRAQLVGHLGGLLTTTFSLTGRRIATTGQDGTVRIWDGRSGQSLLILRGHHRRVLAADFSAGGEYLLTGSQDGTARLFRTGVGEAPWPLPGHNSEVVSLEFSEDGKRLLSAASDGQATLWEPLSGDRLAEFSLHGLSHARLVPSATGPDEVLLVAHGGEGSSGQVPFALRAWGQNPAVEKYALGKDLLLGRFLALSPNGQQLVTGMPGHMALFANVGGQLVMQQKWLAAESGHVAQFSPQGRFLAVGGPSGALHLFDKNRGFAGQPLLGHGKQVGALAFSPDETRLASSDEALALLHTLTGEKPALTATMTGHSQQVRTLHFSGDGERLLLVDGGDRAWLRNGRDGKLVAAMAKHTNREYAVVAMSQDGTRIASCGDDLRLWDTQRGELLGQLMEVARGDLLSACVFSPDGSMLAVGSQLGHVQVKSVRLERRAFAAVHQELLNVAGFVEADGRLRKAILQMPMAFPFSN